MHNAFGVGKYIKTVFSLVFAKATGSFAANRHGQVTKMQNNLVYNHITTTDLFGKMFDGILVITK